ncbi:hypothetical protein GGI11_001763 [Coemansia sp. RSA 2049]|nr:hypothetical protein GGI11_001763 [Coemansia sp. RSA 2049]
MARKTMPVPVVVRPPNSDRFTLDETGSTSVYELGIIRTFDFSASLRRQAVIAKRLGARYNEVYVKGAPEAIRELCYSDTLPRDFDKVLLDYTNHGYRVIALAGKSLKMSWPKLQKLKRDAVEQDLIFMGFLVFENKLKPTTTPVIDKLRGAKIRQIMCTGDNVLTAVSVGRECSMIPENMHVFVPRLVRRKETAPPPQSGCCDSLRRSDYAGSGEDVVVEVINGEVDMRAMVVWESIEDEMRVLDPYTLEPRVATLPVKERIVSSDTAETSQEMEKQQQHYLSWLHNYTNSDTSLTTGGNFCVAITGEVFRYIMDEGHDVTVERMLMRGAVYARMSPDEKAELVERLQAIGYCTGFCGDGANDCGALRAADVGLSLSEAEASVAAPFTSHSTDIQCVLDVIREGRAALVTSFSCFKFMAIYSIVQFTSVSMLYEFGGSLGDIQFLYIDLFIIIPIAVFMGRTRSFEPYTSYMIIAPNDWTFDVFELVGLDNGFKRVIILLALVNFGLCSLGEWWVFPLIAPSIAKGARIITYFARRYLFCSPWRRSVSSSYAKLAATAQTTNGNGFRYGGESTSGNGSPSETIGTGDHHMTFSSNVGDLEDGRMPMTWSEITQKTETKRFKRILREMGIPAWY